MKFVKERHEAMLRIARQARGNRLASMKKKAAPVEPKKHEMDEETMEAISSFDDKKMKGHGAH